MNTRVTTPVLAVDGVSISFTAAGVPGNGGWRNGGWREVVHGVSFDLLPGRVLALVGESGSGKSVTAMSTLGLLPATARFSGSIRLQGEELVGASTRRLRQVRGGQVGTIFQEPMNALNPVFTIGNQIAEGLREHQPAMSRQQAKQRVLELLDSVEVRDPRRIARAFPHEMSGGQLQRAMIAMAIGNNPLALIADEPTTALDVTVQAGILDLLRDLKDRLGMAMLLITHDMGVVADIADDVAVMKDGTIVEAAAAGAVFAQPQSSYTRTLLDSVPRLAALRLTERPATPPDSIPVPPEPALAAQLVGASVVYHGRDLGSGVRAVDDVTLSIPRGESVGLVGESGSGKSTVGRALAGLVPVASGHALLDGVDLARASRSTLRRARTRLGIVFQDPASSLNPRHTIGRSVGEPLRLQGRHDSAQLRSRVRELLEAVQLSAALAGRYPHELSGGQRQRVAIARAISTNPALLIADEPTSALDVSVQARVLDVLRDLQAGLGFACLFISHDLAVVGEVTNQIAVMHHGRIVEQGPTNTVLTMPQQPYTQRLLAAAPVPDPREQSERRHARQLLSR
ncbi:ABC transporter ATP-binding protein [Microlunatus panaciterrae]|uniref:Peptide/nickel transport system ATP-binding protein n=1 Tax=Microlunatus panaciterrae TaxID=400768 RepID=A0ABS2RK13_9ACTN|nr:peptide/nickel transport system ATP-binding protein [Microlunatus panaciterrae]